MSYERSNPGLSCCLSFVQSHVNGSRSEQVTQRGLHELSERRGRAEPSLRVKVQHTADMREIRDSGADPPGEQPGAPERVILAHDGVTALKQAVERGDAATAAIHAVHGATTRRRLQAQHPLGLLDELGQHTDQQGVAGVEVIGDDLAVLAG